MSKEQIKQKIKACERQLSKDYFELCDSNIDDKKKVEILKATVKRLTEATKEVLEDDRKGNKEIEETFKIKEIPEIIISGEWQDTTYDSGKGEQ